MSLLCSWQRNPLQSSGNADLTDCGCPIKIFILHHARINAKDKYPTSCFDLTNGHRKLKRSQCLKNNKLHDCFDIFYPIF